MEKGAATRGCQGEVKIVVRVLSEALATELVCVSRYKHHHELAKSIHSQAVAAQFLEHANEERRHADQIVERIRQLGGKPNFSPHGMFTRRHSEDVGGETFFDMIREDLLAERIIIECYSEIVGYLGDTDPASRWMMGAVLGNEEQHAAEITSLFETIEPDERWSARGAGGRLRGHGY